MKRIRKESSDRKRAAAEGTKRGTVSIQHAFAERVARAIELTCGTRPNYIFYARCLQLGRDIAGGVIGEREATKRLARDFIDDIINRMT